MREILIFSRMTFRNLLVNSVKTNKRISVYELKKFLGGSTVFDPHSSRIFDRDSLSWVLKNYVVFRMNVVTKLKDLSDVHFA